MKNFTITENISKRNQKNLNMSAFEGLGDKIDYKTFFEAIDVYAKAFNEMGVKEDNVVTLCLAGTLDTIINFYALNQIGAVANFVNPNYLKINGKKYINETNSKLLIIMDRFYPVLKDSIEQTNVEKIILSSLTEYSSLLYKILIKRQNFKKDDLIKNIEYLSLPDFVKLGENSKKALPELSRKDEQAAAIVYTSGSTGNPKGVVLTNESFNNMVSIYDEKNGFGAKVGDRNMLLIPPMYGTSLCHCINTPLAFGCNTILQPLYKPQNFEKDLKKYEPNIVVGSKAHYISLLKSSSKKGSLSFLNLPFTGGEPLTEPLAKKINEKLNFLGAPNVIIGYGMSELGTMAMFNMDIDNRINQSGHLLSNSIEARIIDPLTGKEVLNNQKGDLQISTPCSMKEYYNNPEATSSFFVIENDKKWCQTGDIAVLDENGVYNVLGRKNDSFINDQNEVVYLFEIENLIEEIKYVQECEVTAITINGKKEPIVHVILTEDGKNNKVEAIRLIDKNCKEKLSQSQVPYAYKIRDSFATSPISGKRDYDTLKYETKGYVILSNETINVVDLDSEESKTYNEVEEAKKLKLKI